MGPHPDERILRAPCEFETTPGRTRIHNLMSYLHPSVRDSSHRHAKRLNSKKNAELPVETGDIHVQRQS